MYSILGIADKIAQLNEGVSYRTFQPRSGAWSVAKKENKQAIQQELSQPHSGALFVEKHEK
jgi:hypothetical protein